MCTLATQLLSRSSCRILVKCCRERRQTCRHSSSRKQLVFTVLAAGECCSASCAVAAIPTSQTALVCGRASISCCPHAGCAVCRQRCMSAAVSNLETLCAAASGTSKHLESCKTLSLKHQSSPQVPGRLRIRCTAGCAAVRTAVECACVQELAALVLEPSWLRLIHLLQQSHRVWRAATAIRAG